MFAAFANVHSVENSRSPCTKMLPTTLAADESSGGLGVNMTFERVTPKQLPAPVACIGRKQRSVDLCGKTLAKFRKRRSIKSGVCGYRFQVCKKNRFCAQGLIPCRHSNEGISHETRRSL